MSLRKRLSRVVKKIAPIASVIPGPIGGIARVATAISAARSVTQSAPSFPGVEAMSITSSLPAIARSFPGVGAVTGAVGGVARGTINLGRRAASSAVAYCKRHPAWCQTVGGVAAIEAMIARGELPPIKRRRRRGITATELKNFKRVAKFTSQYCAPVRRAMRAPAMRGKSCR